MHENKQSESKILPQQQVIVRYHKTWLVHNNEYKIYHMCQNRVRNPQWQVCTSLKSFLKKISWMLGFYQNPIYFNMN